jgi:hypothetical protein
MKRMLFLLLPVLMFACGSGVEQYRASVDTLVADWDATTSALTEFSATITNDLSNYSQMAGQMQLTDDVKAKLTPEKTSAWEAAQGALTQALQAFAPLRSEVGEFTKTWGEKAAEVQSLKDGLAAGKLEGDVNAKVTELSGLVAQGKEKLTGWQSAHAAAKSQAQAAADAMKALYDQYTATAPK